MIHKLKASRKLGNNCDYNEGASTQSTVCNKVTQTEVQVVNQIPPSNYGEFVTVSAMNSEKKQVKKLTLEDIPPEICDINMLAKLRKVEDDNRRLTDEVNRLKKLITLNQNAINKAKVSILLEGIYNEISKRCNKMDTDENVLDWCPYGCNTCWDTYDYIVEEELRKANDKFE